MIITESADLIAQQAEQVEVDLIGRAQKGDELAWEVLVGRYQEAAFRLAYLVVRQTADAEDVAQEAFVRAFLSLERFDLRRPFKPWLMSITMNLARNRYRSFGRYLNNLRHLIEREPEPVQLHSHGETLQKRQEAQLLWRATQKLNKKGQEIVYLRYFLEMSEAETAETLAVAPGTVKSRLHRALKELRGIIQREFPELEEAFRI